MSREGLENFFKFLMENQECQAKVKSFGGGGNLEALAAYARELGYDVSPEELREYQDKARQLLKSRLEKAQRSDAPLSPGAREFFALIKLSETDESVAKRLEEFAAGTGTPEELIAYGREKGFDFNKGFDVYVDGKIMTNVFAIQMTLNRKTEDVANNKISLYHGCGDVERVLTVELGAVRFVATA